jgi:DNA-binding transcriptional MerR regulator
LRQNTNIVKKLYYQIGEVTRMTGVKPHILRYWEEHFKELKPDKNRAGKRVYTDADIEVILRLKELLKDQKYTTAGARKAIRTQAEPAETEAALPVHVRRELQEIRLFLTSLLEKL